MSDPAIPIAAFEGLMKKAFVERAVEPGLFWDAALKANLYVPLAPEAGGGADSGSPEELTETAIQLGRDAQGKNVLWLFTSPQVLLDYTAQTFRHIALPGQDMFGKVQGTALDVVLIGPGGITLSLDARLVASLARGEVPQPPGGAVRNIPKDAKVKVGRPQEDTSDLEQRFIDLFENLPEVEEASFIQVADDSGPRLLLGLRLEEESREGLRRVAERIARAAEGVLEPGKTMEVTLMTGSLKEAFTKFGAPFYKK